MSGTLGQLLCTKVEAAVRIGSSASHAGWEGRQALLPATVLSLFFVCRLQLWSGPCDHVLLLYSGRPTPFFCSTFWPRWSPVSRFSPVSAAMENCTRDVGKEPPYFGSERHFGGTCEPRQRHRAFEEGVQRGFGQRTCCPDRDETGRRTAKQMPNLCTKTTHTRAYGSERIHSSPNAKAKKKRTRTCGALSRAGHTFWYSSQQPSAAWYSYKAHPAWLIPPRAMVHGLHMR